MFENANILCSPVGINNLPLVCTVCTIQLQIFYKTVTRCHNRDHFMLLVTMRANMNCISIGDVYAWPDVLAISHAKIISKKPKSDCHPILTDCIYCGWVCKQKTQ